MPVIQSSVHNQDRKWVQKGRPLLQSNSKLIMKRQRNMVLIFKNIQSKY